MVIFNSYVKLPEGILYSMFRGGYMWNIRSVRSSSNGLSMVELWPNGVLVMQFYSFTKSDVDETHDE